MVFGGDGWKVIRFLRFVVSSDGKDIEAVFERCCYVGLVFSVLLVMVFCSLL